MGVLQPAAPDIAAQRIGRSPWRQSVTINDVARLAGVSHQTVSRALSSYPNVSSHTRARVLQAAAHLRFRPNRAASLLRGGSSHVLGVLAAAGPYYGPTMTIAAVEEAARERGWSVSVTRAASASPKAVTAAARDLLRQKVEGMVIMAPGARSLSGLSDLTAALPVVAPQCDQQGKGGMSAASINQCSGARLAIRHLIALGHQRMVHLAGPPDWDDARCRLQAYESEMALAGLPVLPPVFGDWTAGSGFAAGRALLTNRARRTEGLGFSAVFSANDQMALGLIRAFYNAGVEVPGDVSVTGFDDIPQAAYFRPPLTTVRQDFAELGSRCVALLTGEISQPCAPAAAAAAAALEPSLIIRHSAVAAPQMPHAV
jgi:DNA-binding LacI/PurR family transcriptional regulator